MPLVYREEVVRWHRASCCSFAFAFAALSFILLLIAPLLFVLYTPRFQKTQNQIDLTPTASFSSNYIYSLTDGANGTIQTGSTYSSFNSLAQATTGYSYAAASVTSSTNANTLLTTVTVTVPVASTFQPVQASIYLAFSYQTTDYPIVTLQSGLLFSASAGYRGSGVSATGFLKFHSTDPLNYGGNDTSWNWTPFNSSSFTASSQLPFSSIISNYMSRKQLTLFENSNYAWSPGSTSTTAFVFTLYIYNLKNSFTYKPNFMEAFVWGWAQYITIFFISYWILGITNRFVFQEQLVQTQSTDPLTKASKKYF